MVSDSEQRQKKSVPVFLCEDYPYKGIGEIITDLDSLDLYGVVYEIKCSNCEMSIRSQGYNVKRVVYERMMSTIGCCGGWLIWTGQRRTNCILENALYEKSFQHEKKF